MSKEEFIKMIEQLDMTVIQEFYIYYDDNSTDTRTRCLKYNKVQGHD